MKSPHPDPAVRGRAPRFLAIALLSVLALAGCKGATPIKDVLDDPSRYSTKEVKIAGTVTHSVGVLGVGAYRVADGTGEITVISKTHGVPREGARVGVQGRVESGYTLGSESLTVLIESRRSTE